MRIQFGGPLAPKRRSGSAIALPARPARRRGLNAVLLALAIGLAVPGGATGHVSEGEFVLEGDLSAWYASGDFVVFNPTSRGAGRMTSARPAAQMTSAKPAAQSFEATLDVVARAPLDAEGRFRVAAPADAPRRAYFHVLNAKSPTGVRLAPVKGNAFILEPGELRLVMSRPGQFHIEGGEYNDAVYNAWRRAPEYIAAQAEYRRLVRPVDGESEAQRRERDDAAQAAFQRTLDLETEGRERIALSHPSPLVRRLVIESAWLHGPWVLKGLRALAELTPDDPWVRDRLAAAEASAAKRAAERKRFAVGEDIRDFVAETLEGESVRLADVRAESKVVLVEFWASWCGPCRVEIPHMKEAYSRFKGKGFEIVSFTIDNEREDWEIASEEEQLPWLNLGMGEEADAPTAYNVTGVPKNYLVDAQSGDILARDLRGHHLDEELERLFN